MIKLRLVAAAAIACLFTLLSSGAAQAYPDCGVPLTLTISNDPITGGQSFSFRANSPSVPCAWAVTFKGDTKTNDGRSESFSGTFQTNKVDEARSFTVRAECTHDSDDIDMALAETGDTAAATPAFYSSNPSTALQTASVTCPVSATIRVVGNGDDGDDGDDGGNSAGDVADQNGLLPNTGGASLYILLIGGALVLAGGGATYAARRNR